MGTVFIEGVPKFKPDLGAEFRRFVSLTDILYGKKVALYLQSEVHTSELFSDAMMNPDMDLDELWAFRRCGSMLQEMQNPKYEHMVWLMRNHMLQESALHLWVAHLLCVSVLARRVCPVALELFFKSCFLRQ